MTFSCQKIKLIKELLCQLSAVEDRHICSLESSFDKQFRNCLAVNFHSALPRCQVPHPMDSVPSQFESSGHCAFDSCTWTALFAPNSRLSVTLDLIHWRPKVGTFQQAECWQMKSKRNQFENVAPRGPNFWTRLGPADRYFNPLGWPGLYGLYKNHIFKVFLINLQLSNCFWPIFLDWMYQFNTVRIRPDQQKQLLRRFCRL